MNQNHNPKPSENEGFKEPTQEKQQSKVITLQEEEFQKLKDETHEYKNKYLQLLADADNARKRLQKEKHEITQYAIRNILLDFLHPIDHMENALKFTEQSSPEVKHWALGFQMILNQLKDVLANNGVIPMESKGKEFDPHLHEALEMITTDEHPSGIVIEESIRGYMIGDKPLRPARVKVSKASKKE
jgi:molecular chaperone GrpE